MRHEYDKLIREIANATNSDFYWVERMLTLMIEQTLEDKIAELDNKIKLLEKKLHASILGENHE